jgi:hypothetical protein
MVSYCGLYFVKFTGVENIVKNLRSIAKNPLIKKLSKNVKEEHEVQWKRDVIFNDNTYNNLRKTDGQNFGWQ